MANQNNNPYYNNANNGNMTNNANMANGANNGAMANNMNSVNSTNIPATNPYYTNPNSQNLINQNTTTSFSVGEILTGALIGAAATYVLTNENVQKTIFKGVVSAGDVISGGLDELKERFEDAKAEHEAAKQA